MYKNIKYECITYSINLLHSCVYFECDMNIPEKYFSSCIQLTRKSQTEEIIYSIFWRITRTFETKYFTNARYTSGIKIKAETLSIRIMIFILMNKGRRRDYLSEREYNSNGLVGFKKIRLPIPYFLILHLRISIMFLLVNMLFNALYCIFMLNIS